MSVLKDKITELKIIRDEKIDYYNENLLKLKQSKSKVLSLMSTPNDSIMDILEIFAECNNTLEKNFGYYVGFDYEENKKNTHLSDDDIIEFRIQLNEYNLVKNLIGKELTQQELCSVYVVNDHYEYDKYENDRYFGSVKFSAYCDDSVNINKAYNVDEIIDLVKQEKIVLLSHFRYDDMSEYLYNSDDIKKEVIENHLDAIKYPQESKKDIVVIQEDKIYELNNKIKDYVLGYTLYSIHYLKEKLFNKYELEISKKNLKEDLDKIHKQYSSIESAICSQIILKIGDLIKENEIEIQEAKRECKSKVMMELSQAQNEIDELLLEEDFESSI